MLSFQIQFLPKSRHFLFFFLISFTHQTDLIISCLWSTTVLTNQMTFQHCLIPSTLMMSSDCNSTSPVEVDMGPDKRVPAAQKAGLSSFHHHLKQLWRTHYNNLSSKVTIIYFFISVQLCQGDKLLDETEFCKIASQDASWESFEFDAFLKTSLKISTLLPRENLPQNIHPAASGKLEQQAGSALGNTCHKCHRQFFFFHLFIIFYLHCQFFKYFFQFLFASPVLNVREISFMLL